MYNSAAWAGSVLIAILVTPYLVKKLGIEGYGVYALLTSLVGYFSLMDLGLGQGVTKYVAEYIAQDNREAVVSSIGSALWVQAVLGLAAAAILVLCADPLLHAIGVSPGLWRDAKAGLYAVACGFFFTMLAGTFSSVLMGLQRYDLTSRVSVATNAGLNLAVVALLWAGWGLKGAVIASAAAAVATCAIYATLVRGALPGSWQRALRFDRQRFRTLLSFSGYVFVSKAAALFNNYIVRFVVGVILGPAAVTLYVVPMRIITAVGGMLGNMAVVVFPFVSELNAAGYRDRLERVYVRGSRYILAIAFPLYLVLVLFARSIMTAWMGAEFARLTAPVLSVLAGAYLLSAGTMIPTNVVLGLGRSRVVALFSAMLLGVGLAGIVPLTAAAGVFGTAVGLLLSQLLAVAFVAYVTVRVLRLSLRSFMRDVLAFHLIGVAVGLLWFAGAHRYVSGVSVLGQVLVAGFLLALYYGATVWFGWVPLKEINGILRRRSGIAS